MKTHSIAACVAVLMFANASDANAFRRDETVLIPCPESHFGGSYSEAWYCPTRFIRYDENGTWATIDYSMQGDYNGIELSRIRAFDWTVGTEVECAGIRGTITTELSPQNRISMNNRSGVELNNIPVYQCAARAP